MKQLRFTTTPPHSMFDSSNEPVKMPDEIEELSSMGKTVTNSAYIHGEAENIAGFDLPVFIDGDLLQLDSPQKDQDILMLLPQGEYKCKAKLTDREFSGKPCYYITLKDE